MERIRGPLNAKPRPVYRRRSKRQRRRRWRVLDVILYGLGRRPGRQMIRSVF